MKNGLLLTAKAATGMAPFVPVPRAPAPRVTERRPGDTCTNVSHIAGEGPRVCGTHIFYNGQQGHLTLVTSLVAPSLPLRLFFVVRCLERSAKQRQSVLCSTTCKGRATEQKSLPPPLLVLNYMHFKLNGVLKKNISYVKSNSSVFPY